MDGESKEEKDGWDKHEEAKLVHEVKEEVCSLDEARHTKNDRWFSDRRYGRWTIKCDNMGGTSIIVSLKTDEIVQIGWLTGSENFVGK